MILKHPSDRGGSRSQPFERLAENASRFTSSATFFGICLLLVALLKNSELRAERAVQRKLDDIAAALLEGQEGGGPGEAHRKLRSTLGREENF